MWLNTGLPLCGMTSLTVSDGYHSRTKNFSHILETTQIADGDARIFGVMIESHLKAGRQDLIPG